ASANDEILHTDYFSVRRDPLTGRIINDPDPSVNYTETNFIGALTDDYGNWYTGILDLATSPVTGRIFGTGYNADAPVPNLPARNDLSEEIVNVVGVAAVSQTTIFVASTSTINGPVSIFQIDLDPI